jgi:hypothetical protein
MRGGTFSNRDSSAAGSASPTSRSGPQQQAKTLLLRRRAGVASSRRVEQPPLVRLQVGAGRSGNVKSLLPQQPHEMLVKVSVVEPPKTGGCTSPVCTCGAVPAQFVR